MQCPTRTDALECTVRLQHSAGQLSFAFDPQRKAILLVAGDKGGVVQRRFYRDLIAVADRRFDQHLKTFRLQKRKQ